MENCIVDDRGNEEPLQKLADIVAGFKETCHKDVTAGIEIVAIVWLGSATVSDPPSWYT